MSFINRVNKYDAKLLEGRIETEGAVIGCLMSDMLLLDDYLLEDSDFVTIDGLFLFKLIKTLRNKNINDISEFDILNINEKIYEKFQEMGGMRLVYDMRSRIEKSNFQSYIDELYKQNAILQATDDGWDFTKEVDFNGRKIVPIEIFKKYDSQQFIDYLDYQRNKIMIPNLESGVQEEMMDITDEFLESCHLGMESGIPFGRAGMNIENKDIYTFPTISDQIGGYIEGTLNMVAAHSNVGKSTLMTSIAMSLLHQDRKILFINNEQSATPFRISFIFWILCNKLNYYKLTKSKLISGNSTDEDKRMLKQVQRIWREEYYGRVFFVSFNDADMKAVTNKIRQKHLEDGFDTVIYDTFKAEFTNPNKEAVHLELIKASRELHKTVKKYNMIGLASMQLAMNSLGRLFLDASCLSQSKQVVEILETLIIMRSTYSEEFDKNNKKYYCNPYKLTRVANKWEKIPYKVDKDKTYRMIFISKCRTGSTSSADGEAMLLSFDGSKGQFKEVCKCKPKHITIG